MKTVKSVFVNFTGLYLFWVLFDHNILSLIIVSRHLTNVQVCVDWV